jgi:hypothetical protein
MQNFNQKTSTDMFIYIKIQVAGQYCKGKSKPISVTGRGGSQGSQTLMLPHFLDFRLTDGGKVISLTRRPALYLQKDS